jgi:hypothetical protein
MPFGPSLLPWWTTDGNSIKKLPCWHFPILANGDKDDGSLSVGELDEDGEMQASLSGSKLDEGSMPLHLVYVLVYYRADLTRHSFKENNLYSAKQVDHI